MHIERIGNSVGDYFRLSVKCLGCLFDFIYMRPEIVPLLSPSCSYQTTGTFDNGYVYPERDMDYHSQYILPSKSEKCFPSYTVRPGGNAGKVICSAFQP